MMANEPTLLGLPSTFWSVALTAAITPVALALLTRAASRPAQPRNGWRVLTPGAGLYAMGALSLFLAVFLGLGLAVFVLAALDGSVEPATWIMVPVGLPLIAMFSYGFAYLLFVRIAFNEDGVERRFFRRRTFIAWKDAKDVKRHWFFGPQLRATDGRKIMIWEYLRGFAEFIEAAQAHGLPVPPARSD